MRNYYLIFNNFYFQNVNVIQYLILLMNETEAKFTSIERLREYNKVNIETDIKSSLLV